MSRRKLREHLFKLVFLHAFNSSNAMPEQIELYLDGIEHITDEEKTFLRNRYEQIASHIGEIDEMLNSTARGWAVELAKLYGGDDSPSFINGILGELSRRAK